MTDDDRKALAQCADALRQISDRLVMIDTRVSNLSIAINALKTELVKAIIGRG